MAPIHGKGSLCFPEEEGRLALGGRARQGEGQDSGKHVAPVPTLARARIPWGVINIPIAGPHSGSMLSDTASKLSAALEPFNADLTKLSLFKSEIHTGLKGFTHRISKS